MPTPDPDSDKYKGVWCSLQVFKAGMAKSSDEIMFFAPRPKATVQK
jgi:hypothetical protein